MFGEDLSYKLVRQSHSSGESVSLEMERTHSSGESVSLEMDGRVSSEMECESVSDAHVRQMSSLSVTAAAARR